MKSTQILLIIVIIIFIYWLISHSRNESYETDIDDINENIDISYPIYKKEKKYKLRLKPYLLELQFHNDYRDVMTAFNNMVPRQKQIFNIINQPITNTDLTHIVNSNTKSEIKTDIKNMIAQFLNNLNKFSAEVPIVKNKNSGFDEAMQLPSSNKGWEENQHELGLPSSLYQTPAKNAPVFLVDIQSVVMTEGLTDVRFVCQLVIQKKNSEDQMIIKISFVIKKENMAAKNEIVMIEYINTVGYLSDMQTQYDTVESTFYDFNNLNMSEMSNPKLIQSELIKKQQARDNAMLAQSQSVIPMEEI